LEGRLKESRRIVRVAVLIISPLTCAEVQSKFDEVSEKGRGMDRDRRFRGAYDRMIRLG